MTQMSEADGGPAPETSRTWRKMFLDAVAKYPEYLALGSVHQPHDLYGIPSQPLDNDEYREKPYLRWSFSNLEAGIQRCIAGLEAAGVRPGMPFFTFNTNGAEHALTYWATCETRCVLVPINPRNLANRTEVIHMVKTASSVVPGKKSVVMISSPDLIKPIEELGIFQDSIKIVVTTSPPPQGWIPFEKIMSESPVNMTSSSKIDDEETKEIIDGVVIFTSGTTSLPKGCFYKYPSFHYFLETSFNLQNEDNTLAGDRVCGVLPNNHALGYFWLIATQTSGAAMIFPGPGFQTDIMLKTLYQEKITHTVLVPTMMHALIGLKSQMGHRLDHLRSVTFGGAVLTPDNLRTCINELGTKGVENAFGMTEGLIVRSYNQRDPSGIISGEQISVGWVQAGVRIRVVDPDTNEVVPRNTPGELHGSAPSINYYIGGVGRENFYNDPDGSLWFKSGDQARLDNSGRLFITGRYKEMIIRGGENMSPIAIETAISKDPRLAALNPQVVGAPDPIAGEVPVAVVVGKVDADIREAVQNAVLKHMENIYVPEDVISLQDMGLQDFPRTMAGKIQKNKLAAAVKKYRADREVVAPTFDDAKLSFEVREIWAKAVGLEPQALSLGAQISEFADSITVMRVRDTIKKMTGKTLSLVDMTKAGTVSGHIELLKKQTEAVAKQEHKRTIRDGPPGIEDMAHLVEDPELFEPTKELILKAIGPHGFGWNDVEDVVPAYDFTNVLVEFGILDSWGFKFAILSKKADKSELRRAFEMILRNNRILASFLVRDKHALGSEDSLHVMMRHDKKFLDAVFIDGGKLKTVEELRAKSLDYQDHVTYPGPLARAVLYDVEETSTSGVVFCLDHAVVDASTGLIFSADLDKALSGAVTLLEHTDYQLWAESYYNQRTSAEARAATRWHFKRLQGLQHHKKALWPPFVMPKQANEYIVESQDEDAVHYNFDAPAIHAFRRSHPRITATVVIKAALTLLTISRTGYSHALFANLEAARTTFPFLPKLIEATGQFEATDVTGPTIQVVTNSVEFKPKETVISFLERMQEDQLNLTKYAAAPLRDIMASLGDAGYLIPEVIGSHMFNWTPGMGTTGTNPYQNYETLSSIVRARLGLSWNAGLGGPEGNTFFLAIRSISFNKDEQMQLALELEKITKWLLTKENWEAATAGYITALC